MHFPKERSCNQIRHCTMEKKGLQRCNTVPRFSADEDLEHHSTSSGEFFREQWSSYEDDVLMEKAEGEWTEITLPRWETATAIRNANHVLFSQKSTTLNQIFRSPIIWESISYIDLEKYTLGSGILPEFPSIQTIWVIPQSCREWMYGWVYCDINTNNYEDTLP